MELWTYYLWTVTFMTSLWLTGNAQSTVTVSFFDDEITVREGESFNVRLSKIGFNEEPFLVIIEVQNDLDKDFVGVTQVAQFPESGSSISLVSFTVKDDVEPEDDEVFYLHIIPLNSHVRLGSLNRLRVTVTANDDAFGVFRITDSSPIEAQERLYTSVLSLKIARDAAKFGTVEVHYLLNSTSDEALPGSDLSPVLGEVTFQPGQGEGEIQLQLTADELPENDETFYIQLTAATSIGEISKDARVIDTPVQIIIKANDAPVRFAQSQFRFDEGPQTRRVNIEVVRGLDVDGVTPLGPSNGRVTVDYEFKTDSAVAGSDFSHGTANTVTFEPGVTSQTIEFVIEDDAIPELEESFQIKLLKIQGDAMLPDPPIATVIINANDNPNGILSFEPEKDGGLPFKRVNEDTFTVVKFVVKRFDGTHGQVTVGWRVTRDRRSSPVSDDIGPAEGTVTFQNGENEAEIELTVVQDTSPESAEMFIVGLETASVTGDAKVEGISEAKLLLEDSDNVYGTVEFGPDLDHSIVSVNDQMPRLLRLSLTRSGGKSANLEVNISVTYDDGSHAIDENDVFEMPDKTFIIERQQDPVIIDLELLPSTFLVINGEFKATITGVGIQDELPYGAFNSPTIGPRKSVAVRVSELEANGMTGFFNISSIEMEEPESGIEEVALLVTREGLNGDATIRWSVSGNSVTGDDVVSMQGTLTLNSGVGETSLLIGIKADDIPEVNEYIRVTLDSIEPSDTQRFRTDSTEFIILVKANDNPGGIIQFSPLMNTSYTIKEGITPIEVIVERVGGYLEKRSVQYVLEPSGTNEFFGATNIVYFLPGQKESRATILPRQDGIPELRENFVLVLIPHGDPPSKIGEPKSIPIMIEENEHPYGIIHFPGESSVKRTAEGAKNAETKVSLEVRRDGGTFGTVVVPWTLSPQVEDDLTPSSGTLTFLEGQNVHELVFTVVNDEIPESDETYAVQLSSPQGGAVAGTPMVATIVILENDNPVEFVDPTVFTTEPSTVQLTVRRQGRVDNQASVNYRTLDDRASSAEGDYEQIKTRSLIFESGEREKSITVNVMDDAVPEGNETFTVQLFDTGGDLITTDNSSAIIHILANDHAYGIFSFATQADAQVEEGSTTFLQIDRKKGNFGSVGVSWEIHTTNNVLAKAGEDFEVTSGQVIFSPQESKQFLPFSPLADNNPERAEQFLVKLTNVKVISGMSSPPLASLATENLEIAVNVKASNDPFGQMAFSQKARELSVAEDIDPGQEASTQATFIVERRQGNQDKIAVLWEVFTDELGGNIPKTYDFLFSGQRPSSLTDVVEKRRPGSGTPVFLFSGAEGQHVTVLSEAQPLVSELSNSFSLSAWVQVFSDADGYIIAHCSEDGSICHYSLRLSCTASETKMMLNMPSNALHNGQFIADSLPTIQDGRWHHIFVSISNKTLTFFLDGNAVGTRVKPEFAYAAGPSSLLVGAKPRGSDRFNGYLQDVRLLMRAMEERVVKEIYMNAAFKDVTPTSGILSFAEGVREQTFALSSQPDIEEEGKEVFDVILLATSGGATLSATDAHTTLAVLKSDNANGLYGFKENCAPARIAAEGVDIQCVVQRLRGDDGSVAVSWIVQQREGNTLKEAVTDFNQTQGVLTFSPGEREKAFSFKAVEDQVAELDEVFEVQLTTAVSSDGEAGSTANSGASIDTSKSVSQITIQENDHPYGLLQFSSQLLTTPSPGQAIVPVDGVVKVNVKEEGGVANLVVLRAQGTLGNIQAEWRTKDLTAFSQGKTPPDYVGAVGSISMASGENFAFVNITVKDNSFPEMEKIFEVELLNPTGGSELGPGSKVQVTIMASDDAYGKFQFAESVLETVQVELGDDGFNIIGIQVIRVGGRIGAVDLYWEATENESDGSDILEKSGTVTFESGENIQILVLKIKGDTEAEPDEKVTIKLTGTSRGSLGQASKTTAVVTISANDDPYGYFIIPSDNRLVRIDERDQEYKVRIERKGGAFGSVDVMFTTLKPDEGTDILPGPVQRADNSDFKENEGRISFVENQKFAEFSIQILDDNEPEVDESIFVKLTGVSLIQGVPEIPVSSSPKLGSKREIYAQIIIASNDDANGRLSLSSAQLIIDESVQEIPLQVIRSGGSIGQVSISLRAIDGTAKVNSDYVVQSTLVVFGPGETRKQVKVAIIEDIIPELDEMFSVELIPSSISEGAALGDVIKSDITILPSDDPNGVFSFVLGEMDVMERDQSHNVVVDVIRSGGSVGTVEVKWEAKLNGLLATDDIRPASGSLFFVTNDQRLKITITILPDHLPEGIENIQIQLISATEGGRIGEKNLFVLRIAPNDSPHGIIEFSAAKFAVQEDSPANQNVQIVRRGGNYGQLKLHFSTSEMSIVELASHQSVAILDLYLVPVKGKPSQGGNAVNTTLDDPLAACSSVCALETSCAAFVYSSTTGGVICLWYSSVVPSNELEGSTDSDYYRKNPDKMRSLRMNKANPGEDFSLVSNGIFVLEDGQTQGSLPVAIRSDDIPELGETFWVELTRVEVMNEAQKTNDEPVLGSVKKAAVTIEVNDNAFGVFSIHSSKAGQEVTKVEVEEADKRAVDFVVKREGGSIGSVTVDWSVSAQGRTATYNEDFIADGATLTFDIGQTQRVISVTLLEDDIPETDEELTVALQNPTGGATLSNINSTTVIILANDFVAGMLSFATPAILLNEGDKTQIKIQRSLPALGTVSATWKLQGKNGLNPSSSFKTISDSLTFLPTETEKTIQLEVLTDENPEVREEYFLNLENITTAGIGPTGAAVVDPQKESVLITIASSDDPHGIFQLARSSLQLSVEEDIGTATLVVDRKFGNIGVVRVSYEIVQGSLKPMPSRRSPASPGSDYKQDTSGFIQMETGQSTGQIKIDIIEDSTPEIDEVFVVHLTGVTLIDSTNPELPPKLADNETEAEVIIKANDGAQGVISFTPDSVSFSASEQGQNISLTVVRANGTFGTVSVFYYSQTISGSVSKGKDFELDDGNLIFEEGESRKSIIITIKDDDEPEPDETFEVILSSPRNGALLGDANRASVTILANDISGGYIAFDSGDIISLSEPVNSDSSKAQVEVSIKRGPGVFGEVTAPFTIKSSSNQLTQDVTPNSGLITFADRQSETVLVLTAVDDEEPETQETFTLLLGNPTGKSQLGTQASRIVEILPSDAPYGLLEIFTSPDRLSKYTVEESKQVLIFDVVRSQGSIGKIKVDFVTRVNSATASVDRSRVVLAEVDKSAAVSTAAWHQLKVGEEVFILVLTSLPSDTELSSLSKDFSSSNVGQSALYRWQGQLTFVETFQTNGATSATSFEIEKKTYIFVTNGGREGARDVSSILYRISPEGKMEAVQSLSTSGASDAEYFTSNGNSFLIVTNSLDSSSNSDIDSFIFSWDSTNQRFTSTPTALLKTLFAKAVTSFTIDGQIYIVIANYYDRNTDSYEINSVIYRLESGINLVQHQQLTTQGAVGITYVEVNGIHQLIVANNRQNVIKSPQDSVVYQWHSLTRAFVLHQTIKTSRAANVRVLQTSSDSTLLIFANGVGQSEIFTWNSQANQYQSAWKGDPLTSLQPITIQQPGGILDLLGSAAIDRQTKPTLYQISHVSADSDFVPRKITLTFEPGQTKLQSSVVILSDEIPEDTETFSVALESPANGAELGSASSVSVDILTNDNAHGVIEFSEDALNLNVEEKENEDTSVLLSVVRKKGFFGRVTVAWQATGDQSGVGDISPLSGQVEFANGQSQATITLYVRDDQEPEFAEVTSIRLNNIVEVGTQVDSKGAKIGPNNVAKITVLANDSPYGVVAWEAGSVSMQEPKDSDESIELTIVRRQGLEKAITIGYITSSTDELPAEERASPGEDFVQTQGSVSMKEGETKATVRIMIKRDDIPERDEKFQVNLTSVSLVNDDNNQNAQPSIRVGSSVVLVTISENDNARGIIEFDVATNVEGRVDIYEEFGKNVTLDLPVKRSVGFFGSLTVTWRANIQEAGIFDFFPTSGTVVFADQQREGKVSITIIDDTDAEEMETFDVKLLSVDGGPKLGTSTSVKVAILKNDSPAGLFKFATLQVETREAQIPSDPNGRAVVVVQRVQGTQGTVRVSWRLSAGSEKDFASPLEGTIEFQDGESEKSITLQTQPDIVLEGREEFVISLVDNTNNANISPTEGDCKVVILPDPGASGVVSILPESRQIIVAEPGESSPLYTGKEKITLTRGLGRFGIVGVTWSITPRDINAFMQVEGDVTFDDLQSTASITVQTRDDSTPELRRTFTLQLNSATGGATISTEARTASIIYAASDYPHGLVQFSLPEITRVSEEDQSTLQLTVERTKGVVGQLRVAYTTVPGEAIENEDYLPSSGFLRFLSGETSKKIELGLHNDNIPEGPESFYINLTSVELIEDQNDYSEINGLSKDMKPELGTLSIATISIDKNDNPEGLLQFVDSTITVKEESERISLAVERVDGKYGEVTVSYATRAETATEGVDYIPASGDLKFADKQVNATISVLIQDDSIMESAETFRVILTQTSGGARLGSPTSLTVTIQKSEYPNGRFAFTEPLTLTVPNPTQTDKRNLVIRRIGGVLGRQQVFWQIMGPNNPGLQLEDTSDISHPQNGQEVTSGSLTWEDGEAGAKQLALDVKPYTTWEVEKVFIIRLYRIVSSPAGVGDGEIDAENGEVQVTVLRFGDPNGVIGFIGDPNEVGNVQEPVESSPTTVRFPIERRDGTGVTGNVMIYWEVRGEGLTPSDLQPQKGSVLLAENQRQAEISLQILPDNEPELNEMMSVILTRVEGGAEIDNNFNQSTFIIRNNDFPAGEFALLPDLQAIEVDPSDLARSIKLNFTRFYGTFGSVMLQYSVVFKGSSLITLRSGTGNVVFNEGVNSLSASAVIIGNHFLAVGSIFTATITDVTYIASGEIEPPRIRTGFSKTEIPVPPIAANSELRFSDDVGLVNEEDQTLTVTVKRVGLYGVLSVDWVSGYAAENLTNDMVNGEITPSSGKVNMAHGQETADITVQVSPKINQKEVFALRLPRSPQSLVNGGARLSPSHLVVQVEQYGLIRFADNSLSPFTSELDGQITLTLWRLYGASGRVLIHFNTVEDTATQSLDFQPYGSGNSIMNDGERTKTIPIKIFQDNIPESLEHFSVVLTKVERFPTPVNPVQSPRISQMYSTSKVTIRESNDPYGIFSLTPVETSVNENHASIDLIVTRSGGLFGSVRVRVRTVGGGEPWTSQIDPRTDSQTDNTIADVLGKRKIHAAQFGKDYNVLNTEVKFQAGETQKQVTVTILEDSLPEPQETILLYLTQPVGGARIAEGATDGGLKGYAIVTILPSDTSNGVIGFKEASKAVIIDEDRNPIFILNLLRLNASFGEVKVKWRAKKSLTSTDAEDADLTSQLVTASGEAICLASQSDCNLQVQLIDDQIPEKRYTFYIILTSAGEDSQINQRSSSSFVTILPSDDVEGLIQIMDSSRFIVVKESARTVQIEIRKLNGIDNEITIAYSTHQIQNSVEMFGVTVYPALKSKDFDGQTARLRFPSNSQDSQFVVVNLTPQRASTNALPKLFEVHISSPTGGARIDPIASVATVQIVKDSEFAMWQIISKLPENPYSQNDQVLALISNLDKEAQGTLTDENLDIIQDVLRNVNEEGLRREYPQTITSSVHNLFCKLLTNKGDARNGRHSLAEQLEKFAFTFLTNAPCQSNQLKKSSQCGNIKISAGRWPPDQLKAHKFDVHLSNTFTLPETLPTSDTSLDGTSDSCLDFGLLEYSSATWFKTKNAGGDPSGQKIISFNMKGKRSETISSPVMFTIKMPSQRVAPPDSKCVYFDIGEEKWQADVCKPTNDLSKGTDTFVDCECSHMSSYAVIEGPSDNDDDGIQDYVVWFYIIAFISMYCLLTTVLTHHLCFPLATFSASLNMHFFMAVFFTQLCFVINAFLSPNDILEKESDTGSTDNSECIVMSVFLQYFFLAQFTWISVQSVNLWKILVLNDEHSGRHFCAFFTIGWGVPAILVAAFYAATYNIFKYHTDLSEDFIYGNVADLDHICFITNGYAALAGILVPVLLALFIIGIVFVKAYQLASQWQAYDDIYRGFYNSREVPLLLLIWALLVITYLWLGLHMMYGYKWLLIMFCISDLIMGILVIVLYAIIRNPKLSHFFGTPKSTYVVSDEVAGFSLPEPFYDTHSSMASIKGSQSNLVNDSWEKATNGGFSQMTVRRALPSQVYINPPIAVVSPANTIDSNIPDFDDLIYALKVGRSLTPSELSRSFDDDLSQLSLPLDQYETKRINIADTHL